MDKAAEENEAEASHEADQENEPEPPPPPPGNPEPEPDVPAVVSWVPDFREHLETVLGVSIEFAAWNASYNVRRDGMLLGVVHTLGGNSLKSTCKRDKHKVFGPLCQEQSNQ